MIRDAFHQVNYQTRALMCVLRLHNGPINCVCVTAGYVATGSDDRFLRLWPLDFNDFLMEAEHESAVTSLSVSDDALRLLVGTESRTMGVLDVCTHSYTTTMRSHFGSITAIARDVSGTRDEFATVSDDGTVRVWNLSTGNQKYEFVSPTGKMRTLVVSSLPNLSTRLAQEMAHDASATTRANAATCWPADSRAAPCASLMCPRHRRSMNSSNTVVPCSKSCTRPMASGFTPRQWTGTFVCTTPSKSTNQSKW